MSKVALFVLLGPPGSGKGTQAAKLNEKNAAFLHVSTGNLFRAEIASGSELGNSVKGILAAGKLVSDEVTNKVFESQVLKLLEEKSPQALLLDGYPRTGVQAEYLVGMAERHDSLGEPIPVELDVSEAEVVKRLAGRLVNPRTGKVYHVDLNPPKVNGVCDEDGGELIQRPDDKPDVIKSRYQLYIEQREGIVTGLKAKERLQKLPGEGAPDEILAKLEAILEKHL